MQFGMLKSWQSSVELTGTAVVFDVSARVELQ